jgi:hypothetical protein
MTFTKRRIDLTFQLGEGATFNQTGDDTVTVRGHRVERHLHQMCGPGMGQAQARVYGLPESLLNKLASLNQVTEAARRNRLIVKAGDDEQGMSVAFEGQISRCQIDMNATPNVALDVMAFGGLLEAMASAGATSYPGSVNAKLVLSDLAHKAGLAYENSGVSMMLSSPCYEGSPRRQIDDCCRAVGCNWVIDGATLAVWPRGGVRKGELPLISPETGMVGYPGYGSGHMGGGIVVKSLFNPTLRIGGAAQVQSPLLVANGLWWVFNLQHTLSSELPGGPWFSTFERQPLHAASHGMRLGLQSCSSKEVAR